VGRVRRLGEKNRGEELEIEITNRNHSKGIKDGFSNENIREIGRGKRSREGPTRSSVGEKDQRLLLSSLNDRSTE